MTCEHPSLVPVWYEEEEYGKDMIPTGRVRRPVSHLVCIWCSAKVCVDGDYMAGPWTLKRAGEQR